MDGPTLVHSAGVQTVNSRRSLVSHGSLDEGFKWFLQWYLKEESRGLWGHDAGFDPLNLHSAPIR